MRGKIPGSITVKNFVKIRGFLEQILKELATAGAKRVVTRLNSSDSIKPAPYFVGIVEDGELVKRRTEWNEPDAGLFRFGDDNPSKVYNEAVCNPTGKMIRRNWKGKDYAEKSGNAKALGHEVGCDYQRFIAVQVPAEDGKSQNVGTITVSFKNNPASPTVESIMKKWAQNPNSQFVKYLRANFILNGPKF